jgi:hypothetical protein
MSVGIVLDANSVNNTIGSALRDLRGAFTRVQRFKEWAVTKTDTELQNAFGYTATEVAQLRSAYNDIDQLRTIFEGSANLAAAKDFTTFAKLLWGLGF